MIPLFVSRLAVAGPFCLRCQCSLKGTRRKYYCATCDWVLARQREIARRER